MNTFQTCTSCAYNPDVPYTCCGRTAGIVGILQSIVLFILAVLAIELVTRENDKRFNKWHVVYPTDYDDIYWGIFYVDFLVDGYGRPTILYISMIVLLPLSLIWMFASVLVLYRIRYNSLPKPKRRATLCAFVFWAFITYLICVIDIIVTIMLIRHELTYYSNPISVPIKNPPTPQVKSVVKRPPSTTPKRIRQKDLNPPTYMWWRNTTMIVYHDPEIDQYRLEVLFWILGVLLGFVILWIFNFILSTFLMAAPFAWRDEYHCSSDCKLALKRNPFICMPENNLCIDPCPQNYIPPCYDLEVKPSIYQPCLQCDSTMNLPYDNCLQNICEVDDVHYPKNDTCKLNSTCNNQIDTPCCELSSDDIICKSKEERNEKSCIHINRRNKLNMCLKKKISANCLTKSNICQDCRKNIRNKSTNTISKIVYEIGIQYSYSDSQVCKQNILRKNYKTSNIKACLRKPTINYCDSKTDNICHHCRKIKKKNSSYYISSNKKEPKVYFIPTKNKGSNHSYQHSVNGSLKSLYNHHKNQTVEAYICENQPNLKNIVVNNCAKIKNCKMCSHNSNQNKKKFDNFRKYSRRSSSSLSTHKAPILQKLNLSSENLSSKSFIINESNISNKYDYKRNISKHEHMGYGEICVEEHNPKPCIDCEITNIECNRPHKRRTECKINKIITNHQHVPCDECYSNNIRCYRMHDLCPECLNSALISTHDHISCEDCVEKNISCYHINQMCIGCRNCQMLLNHNHVNCLRCKNNDRMCHHIHQDCPGCVCKTNPYNHAHIPCQDCTDANIVCIHNHSACPGCQQNKHHDNEDNKTNEDTNIFNNQNLLNNLCIPKTVKIIKNIYQAGKS